MDIFKKISSGDYQEKLKWIERPSDPPGKVVYIAESHIPRDKKDDLYYQDKESWWKREYGKEYTLRLLEHLKRKEDIRKEYLEIEEQFISDLILCSGIQDIVRARKLIHKVRKYFSFENKEVFARVYLDFAKLLE